MPLSGIERPEWNFLKFKHFRVLDDGTLQSKPTKAERPWETQKIRNLLDQITNPESFTADKKKYKLMVSEEKATLAEVKELGKKVEQIIKDRKFTSRGINQKRHVMCSALFDELIRQVVIEYPDLGDILLRIRDHFRQEIYNYEQVFAASQVFGYRKQFMEKNDERLIELETEAKYLLEKQEKAIKRVEKAYKGSVNFISACEDIDVDEVEYWRAVQFYQNYIRYLLYYFDLRAEEEKITEDLEDKEDVTEEEEQEVETEGIESFTLGDAVLEEEEEDPPGIIDEEIKLDTKQQQKEEPIDKDLIYRENEEEVFDSDLDTEQSIVPGAPESKDDVLPPTDTDPIEQLQILLEEEMKHDVSFADIARGYMKEAYEEELKIIEERKRLEEERKKQEEEEKKKLEMEKSKKKEKERKKKEVKRVEIGEEFSEEGSEEEEEEVEEEELFRKKTVPTSEEDVPEARLSIVREGSFYRQPSDESESDKEMPLLTKPKYALLRRLTNALKCKDFVQRIPDLEPTKKRKVKKVLIKKPKTKPKDVTLVEQIPVVEEIPNVPEVGTQSFDEESLTAVRESEFKWGVPLLEYFQQIGRRTSTYYQQDEEDEDLDAQEKKDEETEERITSVSKEEEVVREEESELLSSGLTIGKTESTPSIEENKDEYISIDEEEEEKEEKIKAGELGEEEEEDDESVLLC
ncbi:unnamed protein product [Nezara viridula]|uniref:Uncharacterized protein n=1 Tax=Nezara viridula TaxID=85310 RepID=A0A9P0HD16_NEZVI|nr:unnamed protein product [Nezara viridula]